MEDVVLVTVDSLRADHVGWHGYERETTPNLDTLADRSHTCTNAFAHACSTRPSFPSILTSSYALMYGGYERISPERTLISEVFDEAGYRTAGFHSNLYLSADFDYDRGFDEFYDSKTDPSATARLRQFVKDQLDSDGLVYQTLARAFETAEETAGVNIGSAYVSADEITDHALEWAESVADDGPRFLWVHYMDVHHPYVPPERHQRAFRDEPIGERRAIQLRRKMIESPGDVTESELEDIVDLYDAEIRFTDEQISRLIDTVREQWGDVTALVTADHGEEFLDHGQFSHYATFYDEVLHVPLLYDDGSGDGGEHDDLVGLLDVAPTLVESAGLERPPNFYGESLQSLFAGDGWSREHIIGDWENTNSGERRFSYRDREWKYIRTEDGEELYDLTADPDERENVVDTEPEILEHARSVIDDHRQEIAATETDIGDVHMDDTVKERLRDLGYQE
ncbi:sulfatase [Halopiger aswanensis]|uniref:Arylsulfatase A-like enzyme n=1 Tax=Halopiger aswanensis TaxID=148449 RepID=A0A3R7DCK0_9EURY|nr:sulfatase [Halopiger aswanensis]RKD98073.1 arylsulfatase A-like enzyme [Halopiger aswanensis]